VTSFPEGHFTTCALDRLELAAGISIHNRLASKFLAIASALCLDDPTLGSLSDVFDRWLSGKSSLPPTWQVLLVILRDIKLEELAQEIDDFFNVNRTSLPATYIVSCIIVLLLCIWCILSACTWSSFSHVIPAFQDNKEKRRG